MLLSLTGQMHVALQSIETYEEQEIVMSYCYVLKYSFIVGAWRHLLVIELLMT